MPKNWRNDVKAAAGLLNEAAACGSNWLELLVADKALEEAVRNIQQAIARINSMKTVVEAKKNVRLVPVKALKGRSHA